MVKKNILFYYTTESLYRWFSLCHVSRINKLKFNNTEFEEKNTIPESDFFVIFFFSEQGNSLSSALPKLNTPAQLFRHRK